MKKIYEENCKILMKIKKLVIETGWCGASCIVLLKVFQRNRSNRMHTYADGDLLQRIGSHDYEGWRIQNMQFEPAAWWSNTINGAHEVQKQSFGEFPTWESVCSKQDFNWLDHMH